MRFWDSSAIGPLLVTDPRSRSMAELLREDPAIATWWGTSVECASALARLARDRRLDGPGWIAGSARLAESRKRWSVVAPVDRVREQAERLLGIHPLRAADSLQLAAALVFCEFSPSTLDLVTLDGRLAEIARREGFRVLGVA
jgi:predicted nucleic acid-binding protein